MSSENLLTKAQLAERMGLTSRGVECMVAKRVIPVLRLSKKCVRFDWLRVQAALAKLEVKAVA